MIITTDSGMIITPEVSPVFDAQSSLSDAELVFSHLINVEASEDCFSKPRKNIQVKTLFVYLHF